MADSIDRLSAMDDAELRKIMGQDKELSEFRESLTDAGALTGEARKRVADQMDHMLAPHIHAHSLKWAVEDEQRRAKSAKDCMCDDDPRSMRTAVGLND